MKIDINQILDNYWEGVSTTDEDNQLMDYFSYETVATEHQPFKNYFVGLSEMRKIKSHSTTNIAAILDKYWEGENSVKEMEILQAYFKSDAVEDEHLPFRGLFEYFDEVKKIEYPGSTALPTAEPKEVKVVSLRKWIYVVAAMMVLGIGALIVINQNNTSTDEFGSLHGLVNVQVEGEISNPDDALRITKEALAMVSQNLNKSKESLKTNIKELNRIDIFKE